MRKGRALGWCLKSGTVLSVCVQTLASKPDDHLFIDSLKTDCPGLL